MSGYSRLPTIDPVDNKPHLEEEQIFNKPKDEVKVIDDKPPTTELTEQEQKSKNLKEHLARCREKSIATRRAKAEEKKKNKKPRGRPKKKVEDNVETEVYNEKQEQIQKVVSELPDGFAKPIEHKMGTGVAQPDKPINTTDYAGNSIDYEKLADMVASKMKPQKRSPTPPPPVQHHPTPTPTPQPQVFNNQEQITNFLSSYTQLVLNNDKQQRAKIEQENKKKQMTTATKNYYKKLPPMNLIPSDNNWDNLFNPRQN